MLSKRCVSLSIPAKIPSLFIATAIPHTTSLETSTSAQTPKVSTVEVVLPSGSRVVGTAIATPIPAVETAIVPSSDVGSKDSYISIETSSESTLKIVPSVSNVMTSAIAAQTTAEVKLIPWSSDVSNRGNYTSIHPSRKSTVEMRITSTAPPSASQTTQALEEGAWQSSFVTETATSSNIVPPLTSQPTNTVRKLHQTVSSSERANVEASKAVSIPVETSVKPREGIA